MNRYYITPLAKHEALAKEFERNVLINKLEAAGFPKAANSLRESCWYNSHELKAKCAFLHNYNVEQWFTWAQPLYSANAPSNKHLES